MLREVLQRVDAAEVPGGSMPREMATRRRVESAAAALEARADTKKGNQRSRKPPAQESLTTRALVSPHNVDALGDGWKAVSRETAVNELAALARAASHAGTVRAGQLGSVDGESKRCSSRSICAAKASRRASTTSSA